MGLVRAGSFNGDGVYVDAGEVVAVAPAYAVASDGGSVHAHTTVIRRGLDGTVLPFLYCRESSDEVERALRVAAESAAVRRLDEAREAFGYEAVR